MPLTNLTKLTTEEIRATRGDDQNRNISSFPPAGMASDGDFFIHQVIFDNNLRKIVFLETAEQDN